MKLTIEAVDVPSLKFQLTEICREFGLSPLPNFSNSVPALEPELASAEPVKEPRKRAKKVQPEEAPAEPTPVEETPPPAAASSTPVNNLKEQVFSALKKVSTNKGMVTAKELLTKFKCARISELKEDQFPEFIKACEALAA